MDVVTTFESSFEPNGADRVRQMEVIPAGAVRRRWTAESKARIIAESFAPGANISDVARRHDILPQQLYAWRRAVREHIEEGASAALRQADTAFVAAMVEPPRVEPARLPVSGGAGAEIRIDLCGMTVRVPEGASADHIERVLQAVQVAS